MQFTASAHFERVGGSGFANAQRHVRFEFAHQPVAYLARRQKASLSSGERRIVDAEEHRDGGLVDRDGVNALGHGGIGERVADVQVVDSGDADDVTRTGFLYVDSLETGERQEGRKPKTA